MVVMPVIKLSPNLASKGSEAPMARFVDRRARPAALPGSPFANGHPRPIPAVFAVWQLIISERHLVLRGNLGSPQWLERKNSRVIHCCAALSSLFVRNRYSRAINARIPDHLGGP